MTDELEDVARLALPDFPSHPEWVSIPVWGLGEGMARILVVDDDETLRTMLRAALERDGHAVLLAASGDEGLRTYRRTPCDLVILDLLMPDQEGLQTIRELRRDFPQSCIVAISGGAPASGIDYLQVARRLGARAAIAKPFNLSDLSRAIDEALGSSDPDG